MNPQPGADQPAKPWYRHFWVWFVILVPASAVAGGVATVIIAFHHKPELVIDDWYKQGQAINKSLEAEKRAHERRLAPVLTSEDGRAVLRFSEDHTISAGSLKLALRHPTQAARDQVLRLVKSGENRYEAPVRLPNGHWVVTLEPEPGDWRIRRRLNLGRNEAVLLEAAPW